MAYRVGPLSLMLIIAACKATSFLSKCQADSDCVAEFNDHYVCSQQRCVHEPFFPPSFQKLAGLAAVVLVSACANVGGIGGGEIIVPIYIFFFAYTIGDAVPLSKVTILAGSIVTLALSHNRRQKEDPNKLLIDLRLASLIVPQMLAGTVLGVSFTTFFPPALLLAVLISSVMYLTTRMYFKAQALYIQESELLDRSSTSGLTFRDARAALATGFKDLWHSFRELPNTQNSSPPDEETLPLNPEAKDTGLAVCPREPKLPSSCEIEAKVRASFGSLIRQHRTNLLVCFLALGVIVSSSIIRGGKGFGSLIGISSCSPLAFLVLAIGQVICFGLSNFINKSEPSLFDGVRDAGRRSRNQMFYAIVVNAYFAGALAGTLGMGGGIVITPLLITLGVPPESAAALSSLVVFFTSISTTSQFLILGGINLSSTLVILVFSCLGASFGSAYLDRFIKSYNRPSLIVWVLVVMLLASSATLPVIGGIRLAQEADRFSFGAIC